MIYINGRTPVHQQSDGKLTTVSVNYTGQQRTPISYTNIAVTSMIKKTAKRVFINGIPLGHNHSYIEKSIGDEAGNGGGVYSGTINGKAEFLTWSLNVFIEGYPAVRGRDLMVSNCRNTNTAPLIQPGDRTEKKIADSGQQAVNSSFCDKPMVNWHIIYDKYTRHESYFG